MGSLSDKWHALKNNEKLSQAFMGRVKPDAPLKNRLDIAQKKLQLQITKLAEIDTKLQQRNNMIFNKIVSAKKSNLLTLRNIHCKFIRFRSKFNIKIKRLRNGEFL